MPTNGNPRGAAGAPGNRLHISDPVFSENCPPTQVRPVFRLTLRPEPHVTDPVRALRLALKVLLRRFGLRCISVEEVQS